MWLYEWEPLIAITLSSLVATGSGCFTIEENAVVLFYVHASANIISCKALGMSCATRIPNNNLRNNLYGNCF